jgi:phosphoheptose isomerase
MTLTAASPSGPAGAGPCRRLLDGHLADLRGSLTSFEGEVERLERWGAELACRLPAGARVATAGNGGSAAHAAHLAAELVGRYATDREPYSAVCLTSDGSTLTALANDYGVEEIFSRQVRAHLRSGDVLIAFSTSGRSPDVVAAASAARRLGATVWSLTGPGPNGLLAASDDTVAVAAARTATVQELHQVAIHLLCTAFDHHLDAGPPA